MSAWFWISVAIKIAACVAVAFVVVKLSRKKSNPVIPAEEQFWANKCHETFNEAQRAYGLQDWYSFTKLCEQHALYYRRYQMARDGHFERKS